MKDAQKPDHVSLNTLTERLREGRFVIPDFQREFEWKPWDIRDLIRSIFLDYYIGSLLLWTGKKENYAALSCEPIYGYKGSPRPEYIVLDGQQRLTALYYAFLAPDIALPTRANRYYYFVRVDRFMAEEYDAAFEYDWSKRWVKLIASREQQYSEHIFPLAVFGEGGWALPNWVQGYEKHWRDAAAAATEAGRDTESQQAALHAENASAFGEHLRTLTDQYQVSYIELDQQLEIDKVCDIFTQINSKGIQLDTFDLINALLKPKGLQLKQMWRDAASRLEFVESDKMNVYILQVMSILRQGYCSPKYLYFLLPGQEKPIRDPDGTRRKEVLVADIAEFRKRWGGAVDALEDAIKLLRHPQEFGAISSNYLPYVSIIPAFSSVQAHVKALPALQTLLQFQLGNLAGGGAGDGHLPGACLRVDSRLSPPGVPGDQPVSGRTIGRCATPSSTNSGPQTSKPKRAYHPASPVWASSRTRRSPTSAIAARISSSASPRPRDGEATTKRPIRAPSSSSSSRRHPTSSPDSSRRKWRAESSVSRPSRSGYGEACSRMNTCWRRRHRSYAVRGSSSSKRTILMLTRRTPLCGRRRAAPRGPRGTVRRRGSALAPRRP